MDEKRYQQIVRQLERLEKAVFAEGVRREETKGGSPKHKGATGGIRLLIDEGFFNKKQQFGEICAAASTRGYHYSRQAFQEALNRLATKERTLVSLLEKGRKVYAIRK